MANFSACHAYYEIRVVKVFRSNNCTVSIIGDVWSSTYGTNFKMSCTAQKEIRTRTICHGVATSLEVYFLKQKIIPLDKLINQQEEILAYKVINGTYLLATFSLLLLLLKKIGNARPGEGD